MSYMDRDEYGDSPDQQNAAKGMFNGLVMGGILLGMIVGLLEVTGIIDFF